MRSTGVYLVEVEIGNLKYKSLPKGEILFTLRIGRNYNSLALSPLAQQSTTNSFTGVLQLNVDSSALEAQRCSLSLNLNTPQDKKVLGIALISLPKDKPILSSKYKLTQSEDKAAEIELKIKIGSLQSSSINNTGSMPLNSDSGKVEEEKGEKGGKNSNSSSNIRVKSKKSSEEDEGEKKVMRNYKVADEDRVLEVTEKELRRYKQEKDAYYQMYQIQKAKNEVASKFIATLIKTLSEKYPEILQSLQQQPARQSLLVPNPENKKKASELPKNRNPADVAAIEQLEQANRSLHRQVEEYKRVVEQLRNSMQHSSKAGEQKPRPKGPSAFDQMFGIKKEQPRSNNIIPASLKDVNDPEEGRDAKEALAGLDLHAWLQRSIGQREEIMARLAQQEKGFRESGETKAGMVRSLRVGLDRAFSQLLAKKEYTRPVLLWHRQEVSKVLQEWAGG